MAKVYVTDEVNDSYTQDVLPSGAAEVAEVYSWIGIPSGTASGKLLSDGAYLIHTINIADTGSGILLIGDILSACASAIVASNSASSIRISCFTRGSYLFDLTFAQGISYRLTAADTLGISLTYQVL